LRFQLIVTIILTVAVGLGVSQLLETHLSQRALEEDLHDRASLIASTVDWLWAHGDRRRLRRQVATLEGGSIPVAAIDIFRTHGGRWRVVETTRKPGDHEGWPLDDDRTARLLAGESVHLPADWSGGGDWRLVAPLRSGKVIDGAVIVDVRPVAFRRLTRWLHLVDVTVLVLSIATVSLLLAILLERGVTRPVEVLVRGMAQVEGGNLGARVRVPQGGEFEFLARGFNRMLARLEEMTADLETRVEEATAELAVKNRELEAANERLASSQLEIGRTERLAAHGHMAAAIAHELGTPLNSMLGYTQLLRRGELTGPQAEKLAIIESQIQRMAETIRSMLKQARDQAVERQPVDVVPLVREAITLVRPRIGERTLALRTEIPAGLPSVPGDITGLRQVLVNLITNAIDATASPGTITIGACAEPAADSRGPHLVLSVTDTGSGMTDEQIRRACEPFFTTKTPGKGTGLGLVIVDHLVRAHGGRMVIRSAPGSGTTVRVSLPLEA
jgi:signal transduction histidine kinase